MHPFNKHIQVLTTHLVLYWRLWNIKMNPPLYQGLYALKEIWTLQNEVMYSLRREASRNPKKTRRRQKCVLPGEGDGELTPKGREGFPCWRRGEGSVEGMGSWKGHGTSRDWLEGWSQGMQRVWNKEWRNKAVNWIGVSWRWTLYMKSLDFTLNMIERHGGV